MLHIVLYPCLLLKWKFPVFHASPPPSPFSCVTRFCYKLSFFIFWYINYALSWKKGGIPRVADFIHGSDGLGNTYLPPAKAKKSEKSASEFLVEKVSEYPGEVSILALGPLTNLALVSCSIPCLHLTA